MPDGLVGSIGARARTPIQFAGTAGQDYNEGQSGYNPYGVTSSTGSRTIRHDIAGSGGAYYEENQDYDPQSKLWKTSGRSHTVDPASIAAMRNFMAGGATRSSGPAGPHVDYGGDAAQAARDAAFARAKDKAGMIARSSLDSLRENMNVVGKLGGGDEMAGTAAVVNKAQGDVGEFNRSQLEDELAHQQHVNDVTYQGNITQRGQDAQRMQSMMALMERIGGGGTLY